MFWEEFHTKMLGFKSLHYIFGILSVLILGFSYPVKAQTPIFIKKTKAFTNYKVKKLNTKFFKKKMVSGLTQRIFYNISLYKKGTKRSISSYLRFCKITYDLWDENFTTLCKTGKKKKAKVFSKYKKLIRFLSIQKAEILEKSKILPASSYFLRVNIQLNPLSPKLLKKVQLWLRQSEQSNQITNYLGSFLSLFINKNIGGSDLKLKSKSKTILGRNIKSK
jgi:hypothetical protein